MPLSSSVAHLYPSEAYVMLNGEQRKAMADQITTVSKLRLRDRLGTLSVGDLQEIERAIRAQLSM